MPSRRRPETPTACDCPRVTHRHGTNQMYLIHACGCPPCRDAHSAKGRQERNDANRLMDAAPVRATIREYVDAGHPVHRIATITGISKRNLEDILSGENAKVTEMTKDAVTGAARRLGKPTSTKMDATGTARRIQALNALGWTVQHIADTAGLNYNTVLFVRNGRQTRCSAHTWEAIQRAYDALWNGAPPNSTFVERRDYTRAVNTAATAGWLPPAAWDDDQIDDPTYTPNVTPLTRKSRDEAATDRLDDLLHLLNAGIPAGEASRRAGYPNVKAAYSAAHHKGLAHITSQLLEAYTQERNPAA